MAIAVPPQFFVSNHPARERGLLAVGAREVGVDAIRLRRSDAAEGSSAAARRVELAMRADLRWAYSPASTSSSAVVIIEARRVRNAR